MKTLQLDNSTALRIYPKADDAFKAVLEQTFGKEFFSMKITDRVKSFEDALEISGENSDNIFNCDYDNPDEIAYKKLKLIIKVLNEDWTPDFSDKNQVKYQIWWEYKKGIGCVFGGCIGYSVSFVGSRLCFRSRELAEYAAKQFQTLFNQFLN